MDDFSYESPHLKVSGSPLGLKITHTREKPFFIFIMLAFFALKPLFIALQAPEIYLRLAAALVFFLGIYGALALALDRATVDTAGERLRLRHGPLPLVKGAALAASDVKMFHCEERRVRAAHYYRLDAELMDGRRVKLLSPVPNADDAQYAFAALRGWLEVASRG